MIQIAFSLVTAIIGVRNLEMMLPVYPGAHLCGETQFLQDHSYGQEWRDPSYLHRNTMIIDREVERDAWPTFVRPYFAANDTGITNSLKNLYWVNSLAVKSSKRSFRPELSGVEESLLPS